MQSLADLLASLDDTPASYLRVARALPDVTSGVPLAVAVLSTFTFDTIAPYLSVELARRAFAPTVWCAPFGQLEQVVLANDPAIAKAEVVVVAMRLEDTERELIERFARLSPGETEERIAATVTRLQALLAAVRERTTATIVVWNQAQPAALASGFADASLERSQAAAIGDLNTRIAKLARSLPGVTVFDTARVAAEVGLLAWNDAKLMHLARVPFGTAAQLRIGRVLSRVIAASRRAAAKCIVLDLDNTLWGGVLGEDGVGGLKLGEDFPGNAYKTFQRRLLAYRDRGILLAIASKNNEADVREMFASHGDLVLGWEDFAAHQVHWHDKATSLRAIAKDLNIGLDALVFFDDNPLERAWVREQLPEVIVVEVPKDPLGYPTALDAVAELDQVTLTAEDRKRAELYQRESQRRELETSTGSIDDFLRALEMRVTIGPIDATTRERVCQLFGKTNQFNTTTRRHGAAELAAIESAGGIGLWMRVEDKFGDHGLVGVAVAAPRGDGEFVVDSFLMSCRVLGRRVEQSLLAVLAERVSARGARTLLGEFIPTKKNAPAEGFFRDAGFELLEAGGPGDAPTWWKRDLVANPIPRPSLVHIEAS